MFSFLSFSSFKEFRAVLHLSSSFIFWSCSTDLLITGGGFKSYFISLFKFFFTSLFISSYSVSNPPDPASIYLSSIIPISLNPEISDITEFSLETRFLESKALSINLIWWEFRSGSSSKTSDVPVACLTIFFAGSFFSSSFGFA